MLLLHQKIQAVLLDLKLIVFILFKQLSFLHRQLVKIKMETRLKTHNHQLDLKTNFKINEISNHSEITF